MALTQATERIFFILLILEGKSRSALIVYNLPVRAVIIFFAKSPHPGRVKTRLVPPLTLTEAAELHDAFVEDVLTRFRKLTRFDVELHTDVITDAWPALNVTRKLQITGSLGLKMVHGLTSALTSGYERAAIIGTDSPTLPVEHVDALLDSTAQVTLGPADDGGFWGIAACETKPIMFDKVQWSQADTLTQTISAIQAAGLSVALGPSWFDVDEPADLERLLASPVLPQATEHWLHRYGQLIAMRKAIR
jgi:rSAM/selenodomain-associated transferase 1